MKTLYRPELLYSDGAFVKNSGVLVGEDGKVLDFPKSIDFASTRVLDLTGKALLPGFVNAHSHSFQRLIRGKSESRTPGSNDFWSWRATMYHAAAKLDPNDVYDLARMAFLEMVLAGTTTVGEFHYLHNAPDGTPYDDPNLLGKQVIAAGCSVGLRIVLLRTAYLRSGFELPRDPGQMRFFESGKSFLANMEALMRESGSDSGVQFGVAPHSVRAAPLGELREIADWNREAGLPFHMHISEQVAENTASVREYGLTPTTLLHRERIIDANFTAVHATHISPPERNMIAEADATICACPTTERNLGDGIFSADQVLAAGIRIALGSDSQAQIDPLEDARQLEYHLRLEKQKRAILDQIADKPAALSLLESATVHGARALGVSAGELTVGKLADFFTVDLNDVSIAGHSPEDLLPILVFSLSRSAIRDVVVRGKMILRDQKHERQDEIVSRYEEVHRKVWSCSRSKGAQP
ncbi:MAG TPA: formimidoylglutamate deiminase [Silvibacterium sp.]|nr:formimidoylglutamate deiminase [Silvibacterium sp.]